MLFNSVQFAIFLPIVFLLYWFVFDRLIGKSKWQLRLQNAFVVVASYVFYGWWDWRFLLLIAFTSFCSWGSGLLIGKAKTKKAAKAWTALNIVLNLGILAMFKYYDFFVAEFAQLLHVSSDGLLLKVILPVGISFYTFQALSYSIDVYRGKIEPTKDVLAFFAFISFFPQLVAGPIERATNLLPQFLKKREFNYDTAVDGMRQILWGLFKKIVVADNCAIYVNKVWDMFGTGTVEASTLVLAAVLFAFQIYGDFSGYSDIAIGTAKLFGIRLKDNFLTPYFSRNVAEFWKKWHISLNTWFVDYVYIPLGGNRKGWARTIINTFVIFVLSGFWHGANWTFIGWGIYHSLMFIPLILLGSSKKYKGNPSLKQLPQMLLTFLIVTIGWILFRAPSFSEAWHYVVALCDQSILSVPLLINRDFYIPLFVSLIVLLVFEWIGNKKGGGLAFLKGKNVVVQAAVYYVLVLMIILLRSSENIQFIYFQF